MKLLGRHQGSTKAHISRKKNCPEKGEEIRKKLGERFRNFSSLEARNRKKQICRIKAGTSKEVFFTLSLTKYQSKFSGAIQLEH